MPITRPESFRATDSLISVFVAGLGSAIHSQLEDAESPRAVEPNRKERTGKAALLLQKAMKNAALAGPRSIEVLNRSSDSLSQYAMDAVGLISYTDALLPSLRELIVEVRSILGKDPGCRIIVPLDDADLVPHRTIEILTDLRILSSLPGVVPIVCLDTEDLQHHLEANLQREYGPNLNPTHVATLANQQFTKTIRPSNTVSTPYLRYKKRLDFCPLGDHGTLQSILVDIIEVLEPEKMRAQHVKEWLTHGAEPSSLNPVRGASWLPSTPRDLENIWRVSSQLASSLKARDLRSIGPWLTSWFKMIFDGPDYGLRVDVQSVEIIDESLKIMATAAWTDLEMTAMPQGQWYTIVDSSLARIRVRKFGYPALTRTEESREKESPLKIGLGPAATSAFLFVQDLLCLHAFAEPRPSSPAEISTIDSFYLQTLRIAGGNTDDRFFTFPISVGGVQSERSRQIWNYLVSDLYANYRDDDSKLELFVRKYMLLMVRSWLYGEDPDVAVKQGIPAMTQLVDIAGTAYLREEINYGGLVRDSYTAGKAYCNWFEVCLPWIFHELIIPESVLPELIEIWLQFLSLAHRGTEGLDELRTLLRARVEKNVSTTRVGNDGLWLCGYSQLFDQLDPDLYRSISPLMDEYRTLRQREGLGKTPTNESVLFTTESDSYPYAKEVSPLGESERDLIASVLAQLRR